MTKAGVVQGSCLCGTVRFEVQLPFLRAGHCHCGRCRKHSGTAVCTEARVLRDQFRLVQGANLVRVYGKGAGGESVLHDLRLLSLRRRLAGWIAYLHPLWECSMAIPESVRSFTPSLTTRAP